MRRTSGETRSRYESALDRAHKALYWAAEAAEAAGWSTEAEACRALMGDCSTLVMMSIKGQRVKLPAATPDDQLPW